MVAWCEFMNHTLETNCHVSVTVGVCFYQVERSWSALRKEPAHRACLGPTENETGIATSLWSVVMSQLG